MRLYHPSLHVADLAEAEDFFRRVFGRASVRLSSMFGPGPDRAVAGGAVPDYCTFTMVADVLVDSIDPRRYVVGGEQRYPDVVAGRLAGLGWYCDDIAEMYRSLRAEGFTLVDQLDRVVEADEPPTAVASPMPLFFTVPSDAGVRHELVPRFPFPLDPRSDPSWTLPPVADDDPLGIVRCAHHLIVTADPDRELRLLTGPFGGVAVEDGRDEVLDASFIDVHVGDAVLRLVSDSGDAGPDGADEYRSIAWQVVDLDRVERHLSNVGVGVLARTEHTVVVDPATALGIPWRFATVGRTVAQGDGRRQRAPDIAR